ncbi:hypothetical protein FJ471_16065 [Mesorhizobium sp. B2-7-1]|nr:hypothetical protein FJ471_16065 [Mesorhizobium sp. B2-7-1]
MRPACKWRLPALPVLTYEKYAPLRFSEPTQLVASRPSSTPARPDLNLNRPQAGFPVFGVANVYVGTPRRKTDEHRAGPADEEGTT